MKNRAPFLAGIPAVLVLVVFVAGCTGEEKPRPRTAGGSDTSGLSAEQKANLERYQQIVQSIETHLKAREAAKALELWERANTLVPQIHAAAHPLHAETLALRGRIHAAQARFDLEAQAYEKELAAWKQALDPGHNVVVAGCLHRIGEAWFHAGELAKAGEALTQAVTAWRAVLTGGPGRLGKHYVDTSKAPRAPKLAASLHVLGLVAWKRKIPAEARTLLAEAAELRRKHLPAGHLDLLQTLLALGQVSEILEQNAEAEKVYLELLEQVRKRENPTPSVLGSALKNLADVRRRSGKGALAEKHYAEARKVAEEATAFAGKDAYLAQIDAGLGMVYAATKRAAEAEKLLKKALATFTASPKTHAGEIVMCQIQLAKVYRGKRRLADAKKAVDAALDVARQHQGPGTYSYARAQVELAEIYLAQGAKAQAAKILLQSLKTVHKLYGAAHPRTERLRAKVEKLYKQLGWKNRLKELP